MGSVTASYRFKQHRHVVNLLAGRMNNIIYLVKQEVGHGESLYTSQVDHQASTYRIYLNKRRTWDEKDNKRCGPDAVLIQGALYNLKTLQSNSKTLELID